MTQTHPNSHDYTNEGNAFADKVEKEFGIKPYQVAYSGGVGGWNAKLPDDEYDHANKWLTKTIGEPVVRERWHPSQRVGVPVLTFKITPVMENMKLDHCHLIRMGTHKDKRYTILSWM